MCLGWVAAQAHACQANVCTATVRAFLTGWSGMEWSALNPELNLVQREPWKVWAEQHELAVIFCLSVSVDFRAA